MTTQEIQTHIQEVIDLIEKAKSGTDKVPLQTAIEKLTALKQAVSSESGLRGFAGGPPRFTKDQKF